MAIMASSGLLWGRLLVEKFHLEQLAERYDLNLSDVFNGLSVFALILFLSVVYRLSLKSVAEEFIPNHHVSIKNMLQTGVESILSLVRGVIPHHTESYLPLVGALFIYIFLSNLLGTIPGFAPPSMNFSGNLALGASVFVFYHVMGVKRAGFKNYMGHFLGPSLGSSFGMLLMRFGFLMPLMFIIEIISHSIRPVSLSLRLFGNINGDHLVLEAFSGLAPLVVPVIFLAFGIFVSFIQAFVFTLLSTIYIALAVETHDHGDHHGETHGDVAVLHGTHF